MEKVSLLSDLCPTRPLARVLYKHQTPPRAERRDGWKPPKQEKKVPKGQISGGAERGQRAELECGPVSLKPSALSPVVSTHVSRN